ncbi:ribonuclease III [Synechococcus sp. Minos11]|uniref:ribonuclease III n=1 Tax=Synechococcus sp. Minos11 TaxID=221341 RepID=UPI001646B155|nr:ribonuclease III [Synechococcus sp. Minos11]QNJ07629.1 ribonuclease III [Synechococcus sp. Minos11]
MRATFKIKDLAKKISLSLDQADEADLSLISKALTHSSISSKSNHEELEFLGDAVLRLACSMFLEEYDNTLSVGERSKWRAQLVSDRWLAALAAELDLDELIQQGTATEKDTTARSTVRAECCEALIGAVYLAWGGADGGLHAVRQWLDPHWQRSCLELAEDPHRHNWKSALQELTQAQQAGLPSYTTTEENTNHGDQRRFRSVVSVNAKEKGYGWGPSRRLAEQDAAREALEQLKPRSGS